MPHDSLKVLSTVTFLSIGIPHDISISNKLLGSVQFLWSKMSFLSPIMILTSLKGYFTYLKKCVRTHDFLRYEKIVTELKKRLCNFVPIFRNLYFNQDSNSGVASICARTSHFGAYPIPYIV